MTDIDYSDLLKYRDWKLRLEKAGSTPSAEADRYERIGMAEYAAQLRKVIEKMEALL